MMDLKILHCSAGLASPVVAVQDLAMKLAVAFWIED